MRLTNLGTAFNAIQKIGPEILFITEAEKRATLAAAGLNEVQQNLALSMVSMKSAESGLTVGTNKLALAFTGLKTVISAHPVLAVIAGVVALTTLVVRLKKHLDKVAQERRDQAIQAADDAQKEQDKVEDLYEAYQKANAAYAEDASKKDELVSATEDLLQSLGEEGRQIRDLKKDYTELGEAIEAIDNTIASKRIEQNELLQKAVTAQRETINAKFGENSENVAANYGLDFWEGDKVSERIAKLLADAIDGVTVEKVEAEGNGGVQYDYGERFIKFNNGSPIDLYNQLAKAKAAILEATNNKLFSVDELSQNTIYQFIKQQIDELEPEIKKLNELIGQTNTNAVNIVYSNFAKKNKLPETIEAFNKFRKELIKEAGNSGYFEGEAKDIKNAVDLYLSTVDSLKKFTGLEGFKQNLEKMPEAWRRFLSAMNITEKSKGFFESVFGGDSADDKALREWAEACGYSIDDVIAGFKLLREEADNAAAAAENAVKKESTALEAFRQQIGTLRIDIVKALGEGTELSEEQNKVFEKWAQSIGYSKDQLDDLYGLFQKFYKENPPELIDAKSVGDTLRKARREFIKALSADKNSEMFKAASERLRMAEQSAHAYAQYYILDDVADLVTLRDELKKTEKAWQDYQKVIEGGDPEEEANNYAGALKKALDDIYKGRYDTGSVWGAAKLLFSDKQLAAWKYDLGRIAQELNSDFIYGLFGDPQNEDEIADYAARLSNYLIEHADTMKSVDIIEDPDRGTFQFWYSSLKELADDMGLTEGAVASLLKALDAYGVQMIQSGEESRKFVDDYRRLLDLYDKATAKEELIRGMAQQGVWEPHALEILDNLRNAGIIEGDDSEFIEMIQRIYKEVAEANDQEISINANLDPYEKALKQAEQLYDLLKAKLESGAIEIRAKLVDESEISSAGSNAGKIAAAKNRTLGKASASGTRDAQGGTTLVNEKGPELISDNGKAFIVNHGKPGFVNLGRGAVVFNADETRQIFAHGYLYTPAKAYADGTGSAFDRASIRERLLSGGRVGGMFTGGISKTKTCSKCGYSWKYSPIDYPNGFTGTCGNCGARYENGSLVTTKSAAKQIINNSPSQGKTNVGYKTCPYCQGEVLASKNVCPYCTYNFSTGRLGATNTGGSSISDTGAGKSILSGFTKGSTSKKQNTVTIKSMHDLVPGNPNRKNDSYTGSGGGSSVGSADYGSEADPQKVDWIAVVLNRIQKGVAALEKIASSGFKSLGSRMTAATEQIKGVNKEIETQQKAAERYMAEADSVGLSPELAALVQSGAIDINEYDDETRELIDKYSEWYEKALDAKYAVEELRQEVADLFVDMYNTTQTDFENQLSQIEHRANMVNASIADTKARGYLDSAEYYKQLSDIETEKIGKLNEELDGLRTKFQEAMDSGTIEANSEAWYGMAASIHETEEAIAAANTQLIEYQKTMRSIEWSYFDYAQERFGQLQQEANFLIGIMSNDKLFEDNGRYTDKGTATMGLRVMDYNAYMVQADAYAMEMRKINKELAKDPYDTELIARRETLLGLQQQAIQAAESEKDAIRDLVSQGIQLEIQSLKDLIDEYTKSLDSAKDLYDYQKKISEQTETVAKIRKQITAYEGDNSEENLARMQKLREQLKKANEDLNETEWEHNLSEQKKLLDNLYDDYSELLNARLDDLEALVQEMTGRVNEHMDEIRGAIGEAADQVGYTITGGLNQTLDDGTLAYYDKMFDGVTSVNGYLDTINKTVQEMAAYSAQIAAAAKHEDEHPTGKSDEAVKATEEAVKLAVDEINGVHTSTGGSGGSSGTSAGTGISAAETGAGGKDWAKAWEERNPVDMHEALIHAFGEKGAPAEKHELDIGNAKLRVDISEDKMDIKFTDISNPNKPRYQMAYTTYKRMKESGELAQRLYDWLRVYEDVSLDDLEKLAMPFRSGGLADYTGTAILHGTKQRPELVLNADDTERFLAAAKLMRAPVLSALLDKSFRMPDVGGTNIGDTTVNLGGIYIERVDDADDLVNQLRNNRKFEELIHIVTDGRYMGGQRYDKYLGGR